MAQESITEKDMYPTTCQSAKVLAAGLSSLLGPSSRHRLAGSVGLGCALLWAYWPALDRMAHRWAADPKYSHGYLVPAFALFLLWFRRQHLPAASQRLSWWGLPLLLVGAAMYLAGGYFFFSPLDALALVPSLAGLCVLVGGWQALRWAWPALG